MEVIKSFYCNMSGYNKELKFSKKYSHVGDCTMEKEDMTQNYSEVKKVIVKYGEQHDCHKIKINAINL